MAIFGARGIRSAIYKAYRKHHAMFEQEPPPDDMPPHHASLHGTLVLRYAASFRAVPEALVWLELAPFLSLEPEQALAALAEYVVFKERPADADVQLLAERVKSGLALLSDADRSFFTGAARSYRFAWLKLLPDQMREAAPEDHPTRVIA